MTAAAETDRTIDARDESGKSEGRKPDRSAHTIAVALLVARGALVRPSAYA